MKFYKVPYPYTDRFEYFKQLTAATVLRVTDIDSFPAIEIHAGSSAKKTEITEEEFFAAYGKVAEVLRGAAL